MVVSTTTTRRTVTAVCVRTSIIEKEWVSRDVIRQAYIDCRKKKRNTESCIEFEMNEAQNLEDLYYELNTYSYEIGVSIAFIATRPKLREVFAANFRDRIVHHLLINKIGYLFEEHFIQDTYNCRTGKGTLYGVKRLYNDMQINPDMVNIQIDLAAFFCSINKKILWKKLKRFLKKYYKKDDLIQILWLTHMIVMHEPQNHCVKHGDPNLWDKLPPHRSLFTCKPGYGLAIGNLTSQIFANFYLMSFDRKMWILIGCLYRRYVYDIMMTIIKGNHKPILKFVRKELNHIELKINPKKVNIQPVKRGIKFVGTAIKSDRMYVSNRTVHNAFLMVRFYNEIVEKDNDVIKWIERFVQRYNSYTGYMIHYKSYNILCRLWKEVDYRIKKYVYITENKGVCRVYNKYKTKTKISNAYDEFHKHPHKGF